MKVKRILGIVFIILAILFTLAMMVQIPAVFGLAFSFFSIFTGKLDESEIGNIMGQILYWILHLAITIVLWKYGTKWSGKLVKLNAEKGR